MKPWRIEITKVDNGYQVKFTGGDWDAVKVYTEQLLKTKDSAPKEHVVDMLWNILDYFAERGSRYDKKRLFVGYQKGDKYEEGV